jgi:hypothetical protein
MPNPSCDTLFGTLIAAVDSALPDPAARDRIKAQLLSVQSSPEFAGLRTVALSNRQTGKEDRWISRARPTFLYLMYAMILWALPMGLIAAISPSTAQAMAQGTSAYLGGLPDALYTLFGTGYLGYATLRQWGKAKEADR